MTTTDKVKHKQPRWTRNVETTGTSRVSKIHKKVQMILWFKDSLYSNFSFFVAAWLDIAYLSPSPELPLDGRSEFAPWKLLPLRFLQQWQISALKVQETPWVSLPFKEKCCKTKTVDTFNSDFLTGLFCYNQNQQIQNNTLVKKNIKKTS